MCLSLFFHVSSFLLPVVQKFSKKWKTAIFLDFLSFFNIFFNLFIIFASSGANIFKKLKIAIFLDFFRFHFLSLLFHFSSFLLPVVQKFSKKWKTAIFIGFFSFFIIFFIIV